MEQLRVIVEHDPDDGYVAQGVDFDILGFGDGPETAIEDFIRAFMRHVLVATELGKQPLSDDCRPPVEYEDRWERAQAHGKIKEFEIPRFAIVKRDDVDFSRLPRRGTALVA